MKKILPFLFVFALVWGAEDPETESYRYLTIGNTGTAAIPQTGVVINWHFHDASTAKVYFKADSLGAFTEDDTLNLAVCVIDTVDSTLSVGGTYTDEGDYEACEHVIYHLPVDGLTKGTRYKYYIKASLEAARFDTARFYTPSDNPVMLGVSDFQVDNITKYQSYCDSIYDIMSDFDMVVTAGDYAEIGEKYIGWQKFFAGMDTVLAWHIMIPCLGDHDTRRWTGASIAEDVRNYRDFFYLPVDGFIAATYDELNYHFKIGDYGFVVSMWNGDVVTTDIYETLFDYIKLANGINDAKQNVLVWHNNQVGLTNRLMLSYWKSNIDLAFIGDAHSASKLSLGAPGYNLAFTHSVSKAMSTYKTGWYNDTQYQYLGKRFITRIEFEKNQIKMRKIRLDGDVVETVYVRR